MNPSIIVKTEKISGTPKDIEDIFGLDRGTLANWRLEGKGPKYRKLGRKIIYILSEVKEWLDYHSVQTKDALEMEKNKNGCQ